MSDKLRRNLEAAIELAEVALEDFDNPAPWHDASETTMAIEEAMVHLSRARTEAERLEEG